jgi:FeS assembly SUF system protein
MAGESQKTPADKLMVEAQVVQALSSVFDPEIPVNIYDLGLIYEVNIDDSNNVKIKMTLTAPGCPAAQELPVEVTNKVQAIPEVKSAEVEIVWDPPWSPERMSEVAKLQLGYE